MAKAVVKRQTTTVVTARAREAMQIEFPPLPETLEGKIDPKAWLATMVAHVPYVEPDQDLIGREMLLNVLLTEDDNAALMGGEMDGLQDFVEDFAGATTGAIRILDFYVLRSDVSEVESTYIILEFLHHESGQVYRRSTGAGTVQIALLRYLAKGVWPIECQIVRDKATDQGGRHLLKVWPVDA